jgi:hypothetical protein
MNQTKVGLLGIKKRAGLKITQKIFEKKCKRQKKPKLALFFFRKENFPELSFVVSKIRYSLSKYLERQRRQKELF